MKKRNLIIKTFVFVLAFLFPCLQLYLKISPIHCMAIAFFYLAALLYECSRKRVLEIFPNDEVSEKKHSGLNYIMSLNSTRCINVSGMVASKDMAKVDLCFDATGCLAHNTSLILIALTEKHVDGRHTSLFKVTVTAFCCNICQRIFTNQKR